MLNKRKLHHYYRYFRSVKSWYLLVLAVVFFGLGIYGLRQNNFEMIRLRDAVAVADKKNGDVEGALKNLREFVHSHMNTNLSSGNFAIKPPIQLQYRYERLAKVEAEKVKTQNAQIKRQAEATCARKYPAGG